MTIQPGTGPSANGDGKPAPQPVYTQPGGMGDRATSCRCSGACWAGSTLSARAVAARRCDHPAHRACGTPGKRSAAGPHRWPPGLRDHLDHHLPVLLGRLPFSMCSEDEHIDPRQATITEQPPPGWWDITLRPATPPASTGLPGSAADAEPS